MGSRLIKTETVINAPADRVWAEMTDFASFPSWNPFVREASGRLEPGEQLKIRLQLDRMKMTFKPRVTVVEPNRELRWLATLGRPGVFDVDRAFQIEPPAAGSVLFVMSEECTGWLTPVMFATNLEAQLYRGYDAFNNALRMRVEGAG